MKKQSKPDSKEKIQYQIKVNPNGVSIWVKEDKWWHWILDASTIKTDNRFVISKQPNTIWLIQPRQLKGYKFDNHIEYEVKAQRAATLERRKRGRK